MENFDTQQPFPRGGGEMGELIRNFDWATTSVGPIGSWPLSLTITVGTMLASKFPMFLFWGEDNVQFYNDSFRHMLGEEGKHPLALGQKAVDCWTEVWDTVGPLIEKVRNEGEGIYFEDMLIPIYRNGEMEDGYWTFSYSPVADERGKIQGVLSISAETTEKVLTINKIEDNRKELEFALDAAELGVWDLDPATGKFSGNARLKSWFGLEPDDEIPLEHATGSIVEKDRQRVIDAINRSMEYESGGRYNMEYTVVHPITREERLLRAKGRAWFDENKIAYRFNGTVQDITENRKAQEEIAEAHQLADIAIQSAGMGLFRVNMISGEINYSPMFAQILTGDINKREITRKAFIQYLHPDDLPDRARALEEGKKNNQFYYSPRVIWDDGSVHRMVVLASYSFDSDGNPVSFSGTVRDISILENQRLALENAENMRRESDAMFRNVTNSSPVGLWLSDQSGNIVYANKILSDWTGIANHDLQGHGWADAIIEEDRQRSLVTYTEAIESRSHYDVIFRLRREDGAAVWCRAVGDPYYDDNGAFAGYAGYCMDIDEIIEGRKALTESEIRFKSMIEQAPVATCLYTGHDMKIEVANDIMIGYWGKDKSIIGKPLAEALPELEGQPFLKLLNDIYNTGKTHSEEGAIAQLEVNGVLQEFYFDYTYKPIFDADGKVNGIINMAIDVTDRVAAQKKVDATRRQLLDSFEQSPVGIATLEKEGLSFSMANPFYGELVGRDPKNLIGKPLLEALPEIEGQGFDILLEQVITTGVPFAANEVGVNILRNDAMETIYVDLAYQPMKSDTGDVERILVVAIDVTQQVHSRQKVENSEAALRGAIELAELATWRYHIATETFTYSERFVDWLGFDKNTRMMDAALVVVPEEDLKQLDEKIQAAIAPGSDGTYDNEHGVINQKTGQVRIIHAQAQVTYDENGLPEYLKGTAQDVTKERRLQQQLEFEVKQRTEELLRANLELGELNTALQINNQELNQFAYIASHDLQEPTRKISIFSKMLQESLGQLDERQANYLKKIQNAAERMGNLIRDVLSYSQLSKNNQSFQAVDLNQILADNLTDFELIIEQTDAKIISDRLPQIDAIPLQMSQLFGNLVSNSLKYKHQEVNPVITIRTNKATAAEITRFAGDPNLVYHKLEFSDNGIGFDGEYADRIFQIFQRLHSKSEFSGTGIGLAICKKIVINHHGYIEATSHEGHGAVFTVYLPEKQPVR